MNLINNTGKFVAARSPIDGDLLLIIADYMFWHNNQTAIETWIEEHGSGIHQTGMVLHFNHDADRTAFLLRWS
ncbi:hypothetical protein UFOVP190_351 [uncultured Caudovirales phage]|uniref:Uncharacterized protein n=1 Tax=uncultured Caudovirales phage TaxID=2100421 RepID=A0A6J7WH70_9CAUD|nr:hypothetical protein UFOVP190_351 [uncultured Caudovirales phage]